MDDYIKNYYLPILKARLIRYEAKIEKLKDSPYDKYEYGFYDGCNETTRRMIEDLELRLHVAKK